VPAPLLTPADESGERATGMPPREALDRWVRSSLVLASNGLVCRPRQDRWRPGRFTVTTARRVRPATIGAGQKPVHEAQQTDRGSGEGGVKRHRHARRQGEHEAGIAARACAGDASSGAGDLHRKTGDRVGNAEPRILGSMLALEERVARAAGAHQPRVDRGDRDAGGTDFGSQSLGKAGQCEPPVTSTTRPWKPVRVAGRASAPSAMPTAIASTACPTPGLP
jgi:hypothetical protein